MFAHNAVTFGSRTWNQNPAAGLWNPAINEVFFTKVPGTGSAMVVRVLGVLALILLQTEAARAEERGGLLHRVSCTVIRYYVAKYTAPAAEAWARSKGASEAEIEAARRCIGGAGQALQAANLSAH
ncbi:MAG TPA: hypothetical protein VMM15_13895 [Bradyrhizobium sp.]|nr:hypothetical protein [Bradyrhizobium sp.]